MNDLPGPSLVNSLCHSPPCTECSMVQASSPLMVGSSGSGFIVDADGGLEPMSNNAQRCGVVQAGEYCTCTTTR